MKLHYTYKKYANNAKLQVHHLFDLLWKKRVLIYILWKGNVFQTIKI